ncbi:hypothetical protein SAMN05660297_00560 [Natronincola peptidivorans]|uniref:Uncharacterized protein n=1 Tax=Natronincola peptidivorans TaxID=426128 RepID=A0A1H9ZHR8_9FIRM|nr:hypothetical protein [Natronincola peptidivorans]SES81237.1 hypothetical protein SAMN05660297_00560 [Natronincola peptidivorans]
MEDKVFSLLERMYSDLSSKIDNMDVQMQEMKTDMQEMKTDMQEMKTDMLGIKSNMATKQDLAMLENKMDANHKALYDGYIQNAEDITEIKAKLDQLTDRVENQEIRLQILKSAK